MQGNVNVASFVAKTVTARPGEYELWWEDPRDIACLEVTFAEAVARKALPQVYYWAQNWPKVRVPANAIVGAGEQGWLPVDDWITGTWRKAAIQIEGSGKKWTYTFQPLHAEDIPEGAAFPVEFRRTLKIGLRGTDKLPAFTQVAAYTSSQWREVELALEWGGITSQAQVWDGMLEAFNGAVLHVEPLSDACQVAADGSWRSTTEGGMAGVRALVRYAWNQDCNSYDRTILTLRAAVQPAFSVCVNALAEGERIYLPDLGVAVAPSQGYAGLDALRSAWEAQPAKTTLARVEALPEQTWERAWDEMPRKSRFYFVLGCEGGRQKFRLEPNGDLFLPQNYIRRVKGKDSERLAWNGETLKLLFGLPEPATRELVDGWLPIMCTGWATAPIAYTQEAFATWMMPEGEDLSVQPGDGTVAALVRFRLMNVSSSPQVACLTLRTADTKGEETLVVEGGLIYALREGKKCLRLAFEFTDGMLRAEQGTLSYEVALAPGGSKEITARVPFITLQGEQELKALQALDYNQEREKVAAFWRGRVAQGMLIEIPNTELNRFHKAHLIHMLIVNDREPFSTRRAPRCGGFHYGNFPDEGIMGTSDLDRRGYIQEAEQCLEIMVHYQGTVPLPGDFQSQDGILYGSNGYEAGGYNRGQGWAMWGMAEHYRYTRDRAWLERVAPVLVKACDWVTRERQRTMGIGPDGKRPIEYGFLPAGSLEDVHDYWHWMSTNAYASWGFTAIAEVLSEIDHPEAKRLTADALAYRQDLMRGFNESRGRSPVIKLADGRWVPYYPARLERRGRDFGWLREVLEGSMGLLVGGLIPFSDPAAQWILDDYEDNLYTSEGFGYANSIPDYERYWFSRGGFSMQSNLLLHPAVYLHRDNVKPFLRAFFNGFASTYYPETCMSAEHALPTLADARGDHFKTSDEANVTHYLRLMLIEEHGQDLILGKAIPRAWLAHGKGVKVERALTYYGEMGYTVRSLADEGVIEAEVELPTRNPPARATLRLRHPEEARLRRVEIDGAPWHDFDAGSESIILPLKAGRQVVRAFYR